MNITIRAAVTAGIVGCGLLLAGCGTAPTPPAAASQSSVQWSDTRADACHRALDAADTMMLKLGDNEGKLGQASADYIHGNYAAANSLVKEATAQTTTITAMIGAYQKDHAICLGGN